MSIQRSIENKLRDTFAPVSLTVINESHLHAGHHHSGSDDNGTFDGEGETHFRVRMVADAFAGKNRVERHRAVNEALKDELESGLHALALELSSPGEPTRR
ncbi:MAG: BolA family protein [Phyllobacterium sp.]